MCIHMQAPKQNHYSYPYNAAIKFGDSTLNTQLPY